MHTILDFKVGSYLKLGDGSMVELLGFESYGTGIVALVLPNNGRGKTVYDCMCTAEKGD